jgi:hypothetical protein
MKKKMSLSKKNGAKKAVAPNKAPNTMGLRIDLFIILILIVSFY